MKTDSNRIENMTLLRVHKAGGHANLNDVKRPLFRYKKKDVAAALENLVDGALIELGEVIRTGGGKYRKTITLTDKGKAKLQEMIDQGLVQE